MRIKIGEKSYKLNTKAITAIRFRAEYGFSASEKLKEVIEEPSSFSVLLACLVHVSIIGNKPDLETLLKYCNQDDEFMLKGFKVYQEIYKVENIRSRDHSDTEEDIKFDEFDTVALMGDCGIPERFLDELSIYQINHIITRYYQLKYKDPNSYKIASSKEVKASYGITKEKEASIEEALRVGVNLGE